MGKYTANGTRKLDTLTYEAELKRLQAELVTMQQWVCLLYTSPSPRD